ncbi:MAG: hypothetical protein Q9186_006745 [Xanthomendoza sp. 1 TL-2023]
MTRIRGGTPIDGEVQMPVDDPVYLSRLDELNRDLAIRWAEYLEANRQKNLAEYQPPPDIYTPGRSPDPPVGGLPSPTQSIPEGYFDHLPHLNHQTVPVTTNPIPLNRRVIATAVDHPHQPPAVRSTRQLPTSTPSLIITRSRVSPSTPFVELDQTARAGRKATFKPSRLGKRTSSSKDIGEEFIGYFAYRSVVSELSGTPFSGDTARFPFRERSGRICLSCTDGEKDPDRD